MAGSQWMICLGHNGWQAVRMSPGGIEVHDAQCVEQMNPHEQAAQIAERVVGSVAGDAPPCAIGETSRE